MIIKKYKLDYIIPVVLVTCVILYNILLYFSHQLQLSWIFNSDVSYIPALYQDIILNNGDYLKWHLTPAPYIFPDIVLYSIIIYFFEDYYISACVFFTVQSMLIIHAVYLINRLCVSKSISLIFTSIVFSFTILFPSVVGDLLFVSAFHMGEFVISLYGIYLVLKILKSDNNKPYFLLLGVLSSLILLSDKLYLLHFVLPCIGAILFLYIIKKIDLKVILQVILTLFISIIAGYILHEILIIFPNESRVEIQLENFQMKFNILYELFEQSITKYSINTIFLMLIYFASTTILIFRKKFEHIKNFSVILFLSIFILLVLIGTIFSSLILLTDSKSNNITNRYMIIVYLLPILLGPLLLNVIKDAIKIKIYQLSFALCVLLLFALSFKLYGKFNNAIFYNSYYPDSVKCFDNFIFETKSKNGAAGYWLSKKVYILSKHNDIKIAQYFTNFEKYKWISTENWYGLEYNYFLINKTGPVVHKLDKNKIIARFGNPDKIYNCPKFNIMYYKNGIRLD